MCISSLNFLSLGIKCLLPSKNRDPRFIPDIFTTEREAVRRRQRGVTRDPETVCMRETMRGKVIKKAGEGQKG